MQRKRRKVVLRFALVDGDVGWEDTTADTLTADAKVLVDFNGAIWVEALEVPTDWVAPAKGA